LDSLLAALRNLAGRGLTEGAVLAFLHHRRVVPLMERPLRIFEMTETANPVALARSRMLQSPLLRENAATWARSAIDTRSLRSDRSLWDLEMLPTGLLVERRSNGSGSERHARRSARSDTASVANGGTRSTGCASSRGFLFRGPRSTRPQRRKRRKRPGGRASLIGGSLCPRRRSQLRRQE
jgi:hypothetical protein